MAAQHPPLDYSSCSSLFNSFSGTHTNSPYSTTKRYSSHSQFSDDDLNTVHSHDSYTAGNNNNAGCLSNGQLTFPPLNNNPYSLNNFANMSNMTSNMANMQLSSSFSPHLAPNSSYSVSPDINTHLNNGHSSIHSHSGHHYCHSSNRNSPLQTHQKHTFYDPEANVYVANLPNDYDKEQLFCLFSDCGKILRYKYVQNGYGFVQFSSRSDAHRAIKSLDGYTFPNGNVISLSIALNVTKDSLSKEEPTNLYVKNVPINWANNDLVKLFGNYGTIMQSKVVGDGTAFVRYKHHIEALSAIGDLDKKNMEFGSGRLEVRFATRKVASKVYTGTGNGSNNNGNNNGNDAQLSNHSSARSRSDSDRTNNQNVATAAANTAYTMTNHHNVAGAGAGGVNGGTGVGYPGNNKYERNNNNITNNRGVGGGVGNGNCSNKLSNVNENNLYIKNLPKFYTQTNLEDLFRPFGEIWSVKVLDDGKGFVRFFYTEDAQRAIKQLNGQKVPFSDEEIVVKLAHHDLNDDNIQVFEENRLDKVRDWNIIHNNNATVTTNGMHEIDGEGHFNSASLNGLNVSPQMNGYIRNLHSIIENLKNENRQAISKLNQQQSYNVYLQNVNCNVMNVYKELQTKYQELKLNKTTATTTTTPLTATATATTNSTIELISKAECNELTLPPTIKSIDDINISQIVHDASVLSWDVTDVVDWISDLENNKFSKYKDRLNWSMHKENIDGRSLQLLELNDLDRFGIDDVNDKMSLMKHIKILVAEPNIDPTLNGNIV